METQHGKSLTLPRIFDMPGNSVPEIIDNFIQELTLFSKKNDFLYADSVIRKLKQYRETIISTDKDNSFLESMRELWIPNLRNLLIQNGFQFDIILRLKSVVSLLSKINRLMADGSSIDTVRDLLGIEIIVLTTGNYDSLKSISECYQISNLCLLFFCENNLKDYFSLVDCKCKNVSKPDNMDDLITLKSLNPNIFIPQSSDLLKRYQGRVKDYVLTPKLTTAYQGVQFVVKHKTGVNLEIQIKTQPMREYLDTPNSPGAHALYKENFEFSKDVPQLDLSFDVQKMSRIPGFRENQLFDNSGILAPLKWNLSLTPFGKY